MLKQKRKILRVIDANGNRAAEGLRVVEDHVRFVLNDSYLSDRCKQLRHQLAECLRHPSFAGAVTMRESANDVGRLITTKSEYERTDISQVAKANITRVQQAMRSLEEFAKPLDLGMSQKFEQIRYLAYQLESSLVGSQIGHDRIGNALLYVLVDATESESEFQNRITAVIRPNGKIGSPVDVIQLRDKNASTSVLLDRCRTIQNVSRELTGDKKPLLIVNDRPDVAFVAQSDGVHLGQDDFKVHEARTIVGPQMLIGVSTHSMKQVQSAIDSGANYIGVGPTFASKTKSFARFGGLELLESVATMTSLPAFAIGGINGDNIEDVVNTGFRRVAVSASIWRSSNPVEAAMSLRKQLLPHAAITVGDSE